MKGLPKRSGETHYYDEWAGKTSLVKQWQTEKDDVLLHKWYESEKAGHDIGWNRAVVDYNVHVRGKPSKGPSRKDTPPPV